MSPSDPLIIQDQFYTIQNLQRSPIQQTSNWSGTFFCCFLQQTGSKISTASGQYLCSGKEFFNLCQYITFYIAARHNLSSIFDTTKVRPVFVDKMFTKFLMKQVSELSGQFSARHAKLELVKIPNIYFCCILKCFLMQPRDPL